MDSGKDFGDFPKHRLIDKATFGTYLPICCILHYRVTFTLYSNCLKNKKNALMSYLLLNSSL